MNQGDRPTTAEPGVLNTSGEPRSCYRCGKPEPKIPPFRLIPGSQHIVVCPECYQFLLD